MSIKSILAILLSLLLCLTGGMPGETGDKDEPKAAVLSFDSFDGGGPEYSVRTDSDIVTWEYGRVYKKADHEEMDGAGYSVVFTFTGVKPGEAQMTIEQWSPLGDNQEMIYAVRVDNNLNVSVELLTVYYPDAMTDITATLVLEVNGRIFYPTPEDNSSAEEFMEKLTHEMLRVEMHDYGGFEKVGSLPWTLERNDAEITTEPGDIILWQGNQITIYYDQNTWEFTRLAKIDGVSREELLEILGEGDVTITFWVELSE